LYTRPRWRRPSRDLQPDQRAYDDYLSSLTGDDLKHESASPDLFCIEHGYMRRRDITTQKVCGLPGSSFHGGGLMRIPALARLAVVDGGQFRARGGNAPAANGLSPCSGSKTSPGRQPVERLPASRYRTIYLVVRAGMPDFGMVSACSRNRPPPGWNPTLPEGE